MEPGPGTGIDSCLIRISLRRSGLPRWSRLFRIRLIYDLQKYRLTPPQISDISIWSRPGTRGVSRSSLARDGMRWTRKCLDERHQRVRRRRVVLTPRCWCQVGGSSPASDGGKKADHRGELVISRKATAQGMSDALRCPVCSCAHFLCTLRMRPRVQRASGIPCAL